jgi:hypothetical protein
MRRLLAEPLAHGLSNPLFSHLAISLRFSCTIFRRMLFSTRANSKENWQWQWRNKLPVGEGDVKAKIKAARRADSRAFSGASGLEFASFRRQHAYHSTTISKRESSSGLHALLLLLHFCLKGLKIYLLRQIS